MVQFVFHFLQLKMLTFWFPIREDGLEEGKVGSCMWEVTSRKTGTESINEKQFIIFWCLSTFPSSSNPLKAFPTRTFILPINLFRFKSFTFFFFPTSDSSFAWQGKSNCWVCRRREIERLELSWIKDKKQFVAEWTIVESSWRWHWLSELNFNQFTLQLHSLWCYFLLSRWDCWLYQLNIH